MTTDSKQPDSEQAVKHLMARIPPGRPPRRRRGHWVLAVIFVGCFLIGAELLTADGGQIASDHGLHEWLAVYAVAMLIITLVISASSSTDQEDDHDS